ncbi:hypothetical protein [Celeribacter indicus]|uniref:Uncharacterized protein n=1 Tax=Celeribacter indicus TaxID=1208324 RepID=A0A0B5DWX0_9RHOB|nr:hypothetical protein [Celeribacter indicus]AJE47953.1 hypothetical protein P73_3238 [Celeribacter indicus]SDW27894.1 hypothetical protein SAMN05443573_102229 [Celeribacter indicus]
MIATEALATLDDEIAAHEAKLTEVREAFDRVAADPALSAKAFKAVQAAESVLRAAKARQAPLATQAEQEARDAALVAAEADAVTANALRADMIAKIDRVAQIAHGLDAAVGELDQHAALKWFVAARKANEGGAYVERGRIEGVGELTEMLTRAARKVQHVAADYSARSVQAR